MPQDTDDDSCLEDCLKRQFAQRRLRYNVIGVGGESCQGWVDQVLDSCRDACILGRLVMDADASSARPEPPRASQGRDLRKRLWIVARSAWLLARRVRAE